MRPIAIEDLLASIRQLPSLPDVVLKVLQSFQLAEPDIHQLVVEISRDQALAALVLRLANSPFYGLQTKVATLNDAITVLGFRNVRAAVAGIAATRCFARKTLPNFDLPRFWEHGAAVGLAARILARQLGRSEEIAFVSGLLHDIGLLALLTGFPHRMAEVLVYRDEHDCLYLEAEHDVIGIDHAAAGEALLRHWHFPPLISQAVLGHHLPDDIGGMADIVHVADALVHALSLSDTGNAGSDLVPPLSDTAFNRLGLTITQLKQCMLEVARDYALATQAILG